MERCLILAMLLTLVACGVHMPALPRNATVALGGTSWQLVKFQGGDDQLLLPDDPVKYTITFGTDGGVSARIDCNRGRGTWKSSGPNQLQFGPLALTRAQCPPESLHDRVVKHWEYVRSYLLKDGRIYLSLMADGGIYEFQPSVESKTAKTSSPVAFMGPFEFTCTSAAGGNERITATFYRTSPAMVLLERAQNTRPAFQAPAASGAKYQGEDLMFWEARGEAVVNWSAVELKCKRG